jgi:hypothetical protein
MRKLIRSYLTGVFPIVGLETFAIIIVFDMENKAVIGFQDSAHCWSVAEPIPRAERWLCQPSRHNKITAWLPIPDLFQGCNRRSINFDQHARPRQLTNVHQRMCRQRQASEHLLAALADIR